ncbi:MAG: NF038129 family PEP-CTERM protein [Gammaproteobacteria bacterium]
MSSHTLAPVLAGGLLLASAAPVSAIPITIDTASRLGVSATLSITLVDGDFAANNQAVVSNLVTDGVLGERTCLLGCADLPPVTLDDAIGLGEFLQSLTLGTFISFDLAFTQAFEALAGAVSDRILGELLDDGGFALFDTELDAPSDPVPYQDALFVVDVARGAVRGAAGIVTVPEPASLGLVLTGLAAFAARHRCRAASRLSFVR